MVVVHNVNLGNNIAISDIDVSSFLSLFRKSYGGRYLGDNIFLNDYINKADKIVRLGSMDNLKAAALLRASRLTAVATSTDREIVKRRDEAMLELLLSIKKSQEDAWVTIDSSAIRMQNIVKIAGMVPLHNKEHLIKRIKRLGELDIHKLTVKPQGIILERFGSYHGPHYVQLAWGWQD